MRKHLHQLKIAHMPSQRKHYTCCSTLPCIVIIAVCLLAGRCVKCDAATYSVSVMLMALLPVLLSIALCLCLLHQDTFPRRRLYWGYIWDGTGARTTAPIREPRNKSHMPVQQVILVAALGRSPVLPPLEQLLPCTASLPFKESEAFLLSVLHVVLPACLPHCLTDSVTH